MDGITLSVRYAALLDRCTFPAAGEHLVCGVSGGADSLTLLVLAIAAGCQVTAVHVDHGIRPGSNSEADVVAAAAARYGAQFRSESVAVSPGPNLEARARTARHAVLSSEAALGHTAEDLAETMLMNLVRGAGPDGLAGIRPGVRHPILGLRRSETEEVCRMEGLDPVMDPSNTDPSFVRNRIRREVLPLLADVAGRDIVPILARQAGVFADLADHVRVEALEIDATSASALAAATPAVARVAIREWLRQDDPERHPPDGATVERVLAVARGEAVGTEIGSGRRLLRTAGQLRIESAPPSENLH
ncbi:MesJ tRNA(Ile)-lysidine synthase MesJ [Acidimicrobiia bacterium]